MASANVLRTIFTYPISGLGPYTIAFDYLARKFVQVTLLGPDRKLLTLGTDYRFVATKQIQLINPAPAGYVQIEIRRYTDAQDRLVDFQDGSILRATDLNVSQVQTMHIAEEGRDVAGNTLGVDSGGNLDARLRKMVNLLDGVLDNDAVTLGQVKAWSESALNQAVIAKQQADAASASASAAKSSETNSATTAINSADSATLAQKWAANPQGALVDASKYSAYHYALVAESSATSAQGSASSSSQDAQATSADRVQTGLDRVASDASAAKAKTEADKLGNMNDLAASIKSVNNSTYEVTFKGHSISTGSIKSVKEDGSTLWEFKPNGDIMNPVGVPIIFSNSEMTLKGGSIWSSADRDSGTEHYGGSVWSSFLGSRGQWSGGDPRGAYFGLVTYHNENTSGNAHGILRFNGFGTVFDWKFGVDGVARAPVTNGWQSASDSRTKGNITPINNPIEILKAGRGSTWDSLIKGSKGTTGIGLVIQDILPYLEFIGNNRSSVNLEDGTVLDDCLTMDTGAVGVAVLWEVCKELVARIESLESKIK